MDYSKLSAEELVKLLQEKDEQIKTSEEVIGELQTELTAKEDEIMELSPIVKVGKDSYEVVIPVFNLYDKDENKITEYTAKDVLKDNELAAKLIKQGSGVLRKIEKKK
ncbi:hypothetical protein ACWKW6_12800 [Dyadobacter jiangsuensis]